MKMYLVKPKDPDTHNDLTQCIIFAEDDATGKQVMDVVRKYEVNRGPMHVESVTEVPDILGVYLMSPYIY